MGEHAESSERPGEAPSRAVAVPTTVSVNMLLYCPECYAQHIDEPQPEIGWSNPPHKSHECQSCGYVWRPADIPTNGVAEIQTKGKRDLSPAPRHSRYGSSGF